jgi:ADP-dependent NAD(P)H-hydrate dehydratase / NAD(P)H-hydrate epimerase
MQKISCHFLRSSQPLYDVAETRQIEQRAAFDLPAHTLMQRAGLSVARLTLALRPHAQRIWVTCGPGNNGGDGFEAAMHLHRLGKQVVVTWTGPGKNGLPPDAQASYGRAVAAGVPMAAEPPSAFDFCIDALLGIGATVRAKSSHAGNDLIEKWLGLMQAGPAARLAVDVPTGLEADTGHSNSGNPENMKNEGDATKYIANNPRRVCRSGLFTLCFLTLKPGLFTADGRDRAGEVWFDDLGGATLAEAPLPQPCAWLLGSDRVTPLQRSTALNASHKGSFGDVAVVGGESTPASHMAGAALLAARAALHAGAGRVFVTLLGAPGDCHSSARMTVDPVQPELMFRSPEALDFKHQVIVCGCGGGEAVKTVLAEVLSSATTLVLDADALNAIAQDVHFQTGLKARHARGFSTVLTPHPLEAARLLGLNTADVQADRLKAASRLAERFQVVVVLKGSGTVIAAPGQVSCINSSGNALLATAGTGDVLAGMVGAGLASGLNAFDAACSAVFAHGRMANDWAAARPAQALTASRLASNQSL